MYLCLAKVSLQKSPRSNDTTEGHGVWTLQLLQLKHIKVFGDFDSRLKKGKLQDDLAIFCL